MSGGLGDNQAFSVARPYETVGEPQAVHQPRQPAVGRAAIKASGRYVLDDVLLPVMEVVAHRRDGEKEIALGRRDDVAAKDEPLRAILGDESPQRAGLEIELQQTFG